MNIFLSTAQESGLEQFKSNFASGQENFLDGLKKENENRFKFKPFVLVPSAEDREDYNGRRKEVISGIVKDDSSDSDALDDMGEFDIETGNCVTEVEGDLSDMSEIGAVLMDEFLKGDIIDVDSEADDDDWDRDNLTEDEERVFLRALQVIHLPLESQVDDGIADGMFDFFEMDARESLVQDLMKAFGNKLDNAELQAMEQEIAKINAKKGDMTLAVLKQRIDQVDNHMFYRKDNFKNESQFNTWKKQEVSTASQLLEIGKKSRTSGRVLLQVRVKKVMIDREKLKGDSKLLYYVQNKNDTAQVKNVPVSPDESQVTITCWANDVISHELKTEDAKVVFVKRILIGRSEIGAFQLDIPGLYNRCQETQKTHWGKRLFREQYDVQDNAMKKIGTADVELFIQFHHCSPKQEIGSLSTAARDDYIAMYDILMNMTLQSQPVAVQNDTDSTSGRNGLKISKTGTIPRGQKWILDEFARVYGIPDSYQDLSLLRALLLRLDLIAANHNALKTVLENLSERKDLSVKESEMLSDALNTLTEKLWTVLTNFVKFFPKNQPEGAFASLLEIYQHTKSRLDGTSAKDMNKIVLEIARKAIISDYESTMDELSNPDATQDVIHEAARLCSTCQKLTHKLDNMLYFEKEFDEKVQFPRLCAEIYYEKQFTKELEQFLHKVNNHPKQEGQSFGILKLCFEIQKLNKLLLDDYELRTVQLIDAEALGKRFLDEFLGEIEDKLKLVARNAVALERPLQGVHHTTSVVDLFTSANIYFDILKGLDIVGTDLLEEFSEVLQQIVVDYAKHNEKLCNESIHAAGDKTTGKSKKGTQVKLNFSNSEGSAEDGLIITQDFLHKLNNIAAARHMLNDIIERINDEVNRFYEEQFDNNYYSDEDEDTDDSFFNDSDTDDDRIGDGSEKSSSKQMRVDNDDAEIKFSETKEMRRLQETFSTLNEILVNIIDVLCIQFVPPIRKIVHSIAKQEDLRNPENIQETLPYVIKELMDEHITPNLTLLNESTPAELFNKFLYKIYILFIQELEHAMCPVRLNPDGSRPTVLSNEQSLLLYQSLEHIFDYFHGGGAGVTARQSENAISLLWRLKKLHRSSTENIMAEYEKRFGSNPQAHIHTGILRPQHFIQVLHARADDDIARYFCNQQKRILDMAMQSTSGHSTELEENEDLILSINAHLNNIFQKGTLHLYSGHLFFERSNAIFIPNNQKAADAIRFNTIAHLRRLGNKGFQVVQLDKRARNFYLSGTSAREQFIEKLFQLAEPKMAESKDRNSETKRPDVRHRPISSGPIVPRLEAEVADGGEDDGMWYGDDDDHSNWIDSSDGFGSFKMDGEEERKRAGLPSGEKLVSQVRCAVSRENEGFLFIFTNYLFFESLVGQPNQLIHLGDVLMVQKKKVVGRSGRITIVFKDSNHERVEFRRFAALNNTFKIVSMHHRAFEKFNSVGGDNISEKSVHSSMSLDSNASSPMNIQESTDSSRQSSDSSSVTATSTTSSIAKVNPEANLSGKKLDKYSKRQDHFFDHFNLSPVEERFLLGTKASRINTGKKKGQSGLIYIGTRHICFEPDGPSQSKDSQCVIALANVKCCEIPKRKRGLSFRMKGGSMQVLLNDGQFFEFWILKLKEVVQLIKDERLATFLE